MKLNRKLFSALLVIAMMASMLLPVSAAQMEATYGEASYYDIAVEAYSRMLAFHDGVVGAANQNRQYGLITATGEVRVDFQYDGIWYLADNMFSVEQNGRYGIIDTQGNIIKSITHWEITLIRDAYLRIDGDYFTADRNFTPVSYDEAYGYEDNPYQELAQSLGYDWMYPVGMVAFNRYIAIKYTSGVGDTYYLLDGDNSYRVLKSADWMTELYSDWTLDTLRILTRDGIYNGDGNLVYDAAAHGQRIDEVGYYSGRYHGTVVVETINDGLKGLVDKDGNQIIPCSYLRIGGVDQNARVGAVRANGSGFVDSDIYDYSTLVTTFQNTYVATEAYYRHMAFRTSENGLNGMMDIDGNVLIPDNYTTIETESGGNLLALQGDAYNGGTYGLYDQDGRVIFADGYESISSLTYDRYKLRDNGRYGVMDTSGQTVIPFDYVDMRVHTTDFIEVYDGRQYKIIDLNNNTVVRESNDRIELFRPLSYNLGRELSHVYDRYEAWGVLPFCIRTDEGYATVYADPSGGTPSSELAHRASGINADDMFAYQDDNTDLFGFGRLGDAVNVLPQGVKYVPYFVRAEEAGFTETPDDPGWELLYYELDGRLPDGLSFDERTAVISGVPMESGTWEIEVKRILPHPEEGENAASVLALPWSLTIESNTNSAVQRPNDYDIIDNVGTQAPYDPNSFYKEDYREENFAINGPYEEFYRLLIDGVERRRDVDYTVREGSTIITVRAQTFRDVGEGTHTIAAEFRGKDSSGKDTMRQAAQNYTLTIRRPSDNGGSSGSNSSSDNSGSVIYSIKVPKIPNCTIKIFPTSASEGARITLTVKPNTGYVLSELTVTDSRGKQILLSQADEYKYTFRMPDGKVDISAEVEAKQPDSVPAGGTPFLDVKETDWFYHDVAEVYAKGWMVGTSKDSFSPREQISRGMIVTILHRIAGEPAAENTYFADVPLNRYYTAAAAWAVEQGIVTGYGDGHFGPSDPMTREQIIMILYNYANLSGVNTDAQSDLSQFNDLDQLSPDARRAMSWAYSIGLIRGKGDGILDPAGATTRAETAAFLIRFTELTEN